MWKRKERKCSLLAIVLLTVLWITACSHDPLPPQVEPAIAAVRKAYAPDKRVALFDVEAVATAEGVILEGATNLLEAKTELLRRLKADGRAVIDRITLLPEAALEGAIYGVVRLSACNIRSEPRHSAELATQAMLGTPLRVFRERDGWFLVQTPDGYLGWLDPGGFQAMDEDVFAEWSASEKVVFVPDFGFSLAGPKPDAIPVSDLLAGNLLRFLDREGDYVRVGYPDGREAYIPGAEVQLYGEWLASRRPEAEPILATAHTFLGRPYLWGGTSGKGVDCSGFTKSVFYLNGLLLPRDASQQVHVGMEVPTDSSFASLQPADLLFFGRRATDEQPEKIVHVAIYLGDGKIIHSSGTVRIESLRPGDPDFNEYRYDTFVRARRMLENIGDNGVLRLADTAYY